MDKKKATEVFSRLNAFFTPDTFQNSAQLAEYQTLKEQALAGLLRYSQKEDIEVFIKGLDIKKDFKKMWLGMIEDRVCPFCKSANRFFQGDCRDCGYRIAT